MSFFEIPIRRRVLTTVLVLIAVLLGALAYIALGLRRFPDIEFPMATVTTIYPGGSPEEIETEITKRIEDTISSISGLDEIQSFSQQGISLVLVQFELAEDIDLKAQDIRDKIDLIRRELPEDAEDPIVQKFDIGQIPVLTLALVGPQDTNELYRLADEVLQDRLLQVSGVASVQLTGGERREIQVLLEAQKLRKYRLSIDEVAGAIVSYNADIPAGHITETTLEYNVRVVGRFTSIEEIKRVPVRVTREGTLEVRHLGVVKNTFAEARTRSRTDRQNSIILTIQQQSGSNEVEVVDGVLEELPKLQKLLPTGAELIIAEDTSEFIRGALANVRNNMLIAIILTAITVYLFLGSWRGTVIVGVVIPASIIATFLFVKFSGFSVNILTLVALALSIGTLVNNAILILENSARFMDQGLPPAEAAAAGTRDIALPIFSSTVTNLVVFMPIAFMGEIIGRFFKEFGLTIVYVTVVSLFISYTLTPMMCALLLGRRRGWVNWVFTVLDAPLGWLTRLWEWGFQQLKGVYLDLLDWCLRWWPVTLAIALVMLVGSFKVLTSVLGAEFFPRSDEGRLRVTVETPVGSSLEFTDARVRQAEEVIWEEIVKEAQDRRHYYARVGAVSGFLGSSSGGTNLAEIGVVVEDRMERRESIDDFLNRIRPRLARIPSAKVVAAPSEHGGPGGAPISIEITGTDLDQLQRVARDIMQVAKEVPGTSNVDQSWRAGQPEIQVVPRQDRGARGRLTVSDIGLSLRSYVEGKKVSEFRSRGKNYDIRIRLQEGDRSWAEDIQALFVKSPSTGEMLPLTEVADIRAATGALVITRKNRQRLITVTSELTGERPFSEVIGEVRRGIKREVRLPGDVSITYGGESEMMAKNFRELFKAMATALVLTLLATAGIIESFGLALVIFMSIPASVIGVVLAMLIWGTNLNIFSLMAMVMLVGMLVNNAIIIIDYATREERKSLSPMERIKEACSVRFRVLMMANMTTVVALIPLSLGMGFAGEIFQPLAVVQIGGIIASTSLALIIIPVIYRVVESIRERVRASRAAVSGE